MKIVLLIASLCLVQSIIAQDYRFGKVSEEELQQVSDANYPEANATVLYRNQNIHFQYIQNTGFVQVNQVHERIKIYNKEGFDEATKFIKFYSNSDGSRSNNENITTLKGATYNLEGGKIVEDKLKKDGIFEEVTNKYWKTTKFTMPNIKEGCVIEYTYTLESPNLSIDDIELQSSMPIRKLDFTLKTPEYFNYKSMINPRATYLPNIITSTENSSITLTSKERSGIYVSKTSFVTSNVNYIINILSADLKDIPPLIEENFIDNINNYKSKLILELQSIKLPNDHIQPLSTTWEKVTKTIYKDEDFGNQLTKSGYYNDDIDVLLSGVSDPNEKIALVFDFVKSKVKWNGYYGYTSDAGVSKAYKDGTGNIGDINLMLTSMLRYAGLKANPLLLSTKSNGIPLLPTRSGFNYVVSAVENESGFILLDASQKFSTYNILPFKSLNWMGRLIREDETSNWIDLIPTSLSRENVSINVEFNDDLSAKGKIRNNYTDYEAMRFRNTFENYSSQQLIEYLEKNQANLKIANLKIDNLNNLDESLTQTYEFNLNEAVESIGDNLYFSPLLFLRNSENPFKENSRNYPIDFIFPSADRYMVNIKIPEGYEVESLPQNSRLQFNDSVGEFTYIGTQNGDYLQFIISTEINKTLILADDYKLFKEFFQQMTEKQSEKVVLKKV